MPNVPWHPSASLDALRAVASLRAALRDYMQNENVLEVVTPALSSAGNTDPHVNCTTIPCQGLQAPRYLHTSPEFAMKRLLAAYGVDIYQLSAVFREGEVGRWHNPEFSLLEWYRIGMDHRQLMSDVEHLLAFVFCEFQIPWRTPVQVTYADAVHGAIGISISTITVALIERAFTDHKRSFPRSIGTDLDAALALLVDEFVLPGFAPDRMTFLVDYPATQAALARISDNQEGYAIAERFEAYWGQIELANGFHELTDVVEQRARISQDLIVRARSGLTAPAVDEHFLAALEYGMPACAGVALGVDRLAIVLTDANRIDQVLAFDSSRA